MTADAKMSKENRLQENLQAFKTLFIEELPNKMRELHAALQACLNEPENKEALTALNQRLHTLAVAASTYGFIEFSLRAHSLVEQLKLLLTAPGEISQNFAPIAMELEELLRWAEIDPKTGTMTRLRRRPPVPVKDLASAPVYLVNDNVLLAEDTALQLKYFGYDVVVINDFGRLPAAIAQRPPAAIILDLGYRKEKPLAAADVEHIRQSSGQRFPTIFLSSRSNFKARLDAVRAGADGYFVKPLDVVTLVDRLDALTVRKEIHPYRILIIGDEPASAKQYGAMLKEAGMDVKVLHEPTEIFQVLGEYRPEILLMDVHMPDCTGSDLARLIRQTNMYLDVPIVFLSNESSFSKQMDAIESGADDFRTKPIEPAHLISSIANRAERYRALRGLIMRDGLTGLYNHSATKEHLMREISRATRSETPLALAMIDLDFFKKVNDTYGHPVGDQVIRALSRLLQQRLRRGDIIGRYGGEEFVAILPGTTASAAAGVLEQIREVFSKIRHRAEEREFTSSFSAGVAELTPDQDNDALFRAADSALYEAKHKGRNCVVTK